MAKLYRKEIKGKEGLGQRGKKKKTPAPKAPLDRDIVVVAAVLSYYPIHYQSSIIKVYLYLSRSLFLPMILYVAIFVYSS